MVDLMFDNNGIFDWKFELLVRNVSYYRMEETFKLLMMNVKIMILK